MEMLDLALDAAVGAGAGFALARAVDSETEVLAVSTRRDPERRTLSVAQVGIWSQTRSGWGYCCVDAPTPESVRSAARRAVELTIAGPPDVDELPPPVQGDWASPVARDPFDMPVERKIELLTPVIEAHEIDDRLRESAVRVEARRERRSLACTRGMRVRQSLVQTGARLLVTAEGENGRRSRSYPARHGAYATAGWEWVEGLGLGTAAPTIASEAVALTEARPLASQTGRVVIGGNQMAMQVHESIGHALEVDRIRGWERDYAGASFVEPDDVGRLRYGSDLLDVYSDPGETPGVGGFWVDDHGAPARRTQLIERGRLVGLIGSSTCRVPGASISVSARAEGGGFPLVRMSNVSIAPGAGTLDELLGEMGDGILLDGTRSFSIDDRRDLFHFGCEAAWEIRGGRRVRILRDPVYSGRTLEFWRTCRQIGGPQSWRPWSVTFCKKGSPIQTVRVGHGTAPALFDSVSVGAS